MTPVEVISKKYKDKLFCFSPPVMIATCVIELTLLLYTIWRYKFNTVTRLVTLLLLCLSIFQLAEYRVCTGSSGVVQWSHLGYIAITVLPILGIHIINAITGRKNNFLVYAGYLTAAGFVAYFALSANSLDGHACLGNYVLFQVNANLTWLYGLYYYGWVVIGGLMSLGFANRSKVKRQKQALLGFAVGYASFLVPTTTANLLNKATLNGIPSIMCGFAVLLAIITVLWVMPRVGKRRVA
jgi:hypothetical protein